MVAMVMIGVFQLKKRTKTSDGFFLAGRDIRWPLIGLSLFAANISTIHLVGLASSGFNEGMVWGCFEWLAVVTLIILSFVFAPFYFKSRIQTLPEFLERRYDARSRTVFAFIAILGALFVHIGMSLYTGAIIFERFFGIGMWTSITLISVVTLVYYLAGGLKAVVYTQAVQTAILLFGSLALTVAGILKLTDYMEAMNMTGGFMANFIDLLRPGQLDVLHNKESLGALTETINGEFASRGFKKVSDSGLTWYAAFLGYPILGLWYWCSDQTIVQQVLAAKTEDDARRGPIFAGFLKTMTPFLMILPGVIGYAIFKEDIFAAANAAMVNKPGDMTLVVLIDKLLPVGLTGLFAAALIAALMSTVAAALNSISTLVSIDIYKRIKPQSKESNILLVGRVASIIVMVLAALWSTQGGKFSSVFEAINKVASALSPSVAAVLLLGVLSKRGTKEASFVTLLAGLSLGILCFILDFKFTPGGVSYITEVLGIPFMMQAWWLFCICVLIYIIVSMFTKAPDAEVVEKYSWKNPREILGGKIKSINDVRVWTIILIIIMICLYVYFS